MISSTILHILVIVIYFRYLYRKLDAIIVTAESLKTE